MTEEEYELTFAEWCNKTKGTNILTTEWGSLIHEGDNISNYMNLRELYWGEWISERKELVYRKKSEQINNALMSLKNEGIKCRLASFQNGHIVAETKHKTKLSYYATRGTIAGYADTFVHGLDEFIRLCKE